MLQRPPNKSAPAETQGRQRCRECHCKIEPTESDRSAFCDERCFKAYFASICLVCEQPFTHKSRAPHQRFCRDRCRKKFERYPHRYLGRFYSRLGPADKAPKGVKPDASVGRGKNPTKSTTKSATKSDRAWRVVAGPIPSEANLIVPLDPETAERTRRTNARFWPKASKIKPEDWP
jgi:hypothetical protein